MQRGKPRKRRRADSGRALRVAPWLSLALLPSACVESPSCDACEIALDEVVALEDAGFTMSSRVVRTGDGGFAAIGTYDPERLVRFDPSGSIVHSAGRRGNGPGEFNSLSSLALGNGDTLFLVDGPRVHVVDPDLTWVRTITTPRMPDDLLILGDGSIVGRAAATSRGLPSLYRLDPDSSSDVAWIDDQDDDVRMSAFRVISAHDAEIWSVGRIGLDVEVFDLEGAPVRSFHIEHPWFGGDRDGSVRVVDVEHAPGGELLVLVGRERPDWEPPGASAPVGEAAPVQLSAVQFVDRWEQQILLVDRNGEITATSGAHADVGLLGFADGEHVYGFPRAEDVALRIWHVGHPEPRTGTWP